jgi:hypothetical protein
LPSSVGAIVGFFVFIVPGLVYELELRRRRPEREESAFVETSRVLLAGAAATFASGTVLWVLRSVAPGALPDPSELLVTGRPYLDTHVRLVFAGAVLELLTAVAMILLIGGLTHGLTRRGIRNTSMWTWLLYDEVPAGRSPLLMVALKDSGTRIEGFLFTVSTHHDVDRRELVLRRVRIQETPGAAWRAWPDQWRRIVIPGREIAWLGIAHAAIPGLPGPTSPGRAEKTWEWLRLHQWQAALIFLVVEAAVLVGVG